MQHNHSLCKQEGVSHSSPATVGPTPGQGGSQVPSSRGLHHGRGSAQLSPAPCPRMSVPTPLHPEEFYCFQELAAWSQT